MPLRTVLLWFSPERVEILHQALLGNCVITKRYQDSTGQACIMGYLDPSLHSRWDLEAKYPDPEQYRLTRVVIENWDTGTLTAEQAISVLEDVLKERRQQAEEPMLAAVG